MMVNTSYRIVHNVEEAEDIVQETFINIHYKLKKFHHKSSLGYWLKKIIINTSINALKKRKTINLDEETSYNKHDLSDPTLYIENYDNEIERKNQVQRILEAIKQLPPGYRTIVAMYLIDDVNHKSIASHLNIAESTVRSQYIRGKKKLLEILKTHSHEK